MERWGLRPNMLLGYLEGQGELVSRLVTAIAHIISRRLSESLTLQVRFWVGAINEMPCSACTGCKGSGRSSDCRGVLEVQYAGSLLNLLK